MSSIAVVPVEEYLSTTYRPDCDYVDGEVRERHVGEYEHANLQARLTIWFPNHANGTFACWWSSGFG